MVAFEVQHLSYSPQTWKVFFLFSCCLRQPMDIYHSQCITDNTYILFGQIGACLLHILMHCSDIHAYNLYVLLDFLPIAALYILAVCSSHEGDFADAETLSRTALSVCHCCVSEDHAASGIGTFCHAFATASHSSTLLICFYHIAITSSFTVSHSTGQSGKLLP
jgi:hypothetical protein